MLNSLNKGAKVLNKGAKLLSRGAKVLNNGAKFNSCPKFSRIYKI